MKSIVAVVFAVTLGGAVAAHADGVRIGVGRPLSPRGVIVQDRGLEVFGERRITVGQNPNCYANGQWVCGGRPPGPATQNCYSPTGQWICGGAPPPQRDHRHRRPIVVPTPVYVVPSQHCLVPGYWTTQWVPQTTLYNVWVPGQWLSDGSWIEGRYEQRPYVWWYTHQPIWVPERWVC